MTLLAPSSCQGNNRPECKLMLPGFLLLLILLCVELCGAAYASSSLYTKVNLEDKQYLILDIRTTKLMILEGADAYQFDKQILLPVASLLQLLEMNMQVSGEPGILNFIQDGKSYRIDLNNDNELSFMPNITGPIYWTDQESELLVSHILIEALIEAKFDFNMSRLTGQITDQVNLFPVEQRLLREKLRGFMPTAEAPDEDSKPQLVFADEFILDSYHLLGKPQTNISLSLTSQDSGLVDSQLNKLEYKGSIQTVSDLFYHYAQLTLNKASNGELNSNLRFSRNQSSPYEDLFLGVNRYSFGDVFGKADDLTTNNQSGLGLSFARRPINHSSKFGSVTIEDTAQPGWEIELYRGGVLLQSGLVPDDGRYVFANVQTLYGVNRFKVKLYGPYGEEEVHHKNIRINSTQLKHKQFGFDGYIIDAGNNLLSNKGEEDTFKPDTFKPDTFGFSFDYGVLPELNIGFSLTQKSNLDDNRQQFIGTNLQASVPGALFNLSLSHQLKEGYAGIASVAGQFGQDTTYQLAYENNNNHDFQGVNVQSERYSGSLSGRLSHFFINNIASLNRIDDREILNITSRLATQVAKISLSHVLQYNQFSNINKTSVADSESITGEVSAAGRLTANSRIAASASYDLKNNAEIRRVKLSGSFRFNDNINWSGQVEYFIDSINDWRVNNALSWVTDDMTFYSSMAYDAIDSWSVALGVRFSLGYDYHNNNWIMSGRNMTSSGSLDINSYLDQNNNQRLDEGDVALPDVQFGHVRQWQGIRSADNGQAILPFVTPFRATNFSPKWVDGVSPTTKSYAVYTHPGGMIKAEIPFTVKTTVIGFVLLSEEDGEPFASAEVQLVNQQGVVISIIDSDIDGFFEFIDIEPGQYQVRLKQEFLATLALQSSPSKLAFTTPPAGGYFELGVILAVPLSQSVADLVKVVTPNSGNYESISEVEKLLERINNLKSIDNTLNNTKDVESDTDLDMPFLVASGILKSASVLPPENQKMLEILLTQTQPIDQNQLSTVVVSSLGVRPESNADTNININTLDTNTVDTNTVDTNQIVDDRSTSLPRQGFTIQLMVARNQQSIDEALIRVPLGNDVYQVKKNVKGNELNVLLIGQYETRDLAQKAVAGLPEFWGNKTWIRLLSALQ
jgi:hypothetical protein